jgi:hypothetical protein
MKKLMLLVFILMAYNISCSVFRSSSEAEEEEGSLVTTRKFAGVFIDFRHTVTEDLPRTDLIWIKTTLENKYGKICANGKSCKFTVGERLYLKRKFLNPGMVGGIWEYYIENDSSVMYQLTEFQSDRKVFVESWY